MRKIDIWSEVHGTGTSTSAINLSIAFTKKGYRVLLIDVCPHCSATLTSGFYRIHNRDNPPINTNDLIMNIAKGIASPPEELIKKAILRSEHGYDVITNTPDMDFHIIEFGLYPGYELFLKKALEPIEDYDFIVMDSATGYFCLAEMCLAYAEELYVPLCKDRYSGDIRRIIAEAQKSFAPNIKLKGVFNTMVRRYRKSAISHAQLNNTLMKTNIRYTESLKVGIKKDSFEPQYSWKPKSIGAVDYMELAEEIIANC